MDFDLDADIEDNEKGTETPEITNEQDTFSADEVIDTFILNEAFEDQILNESAKINVNNERKIRVISKEQKFKRLVYKISILMSRKSNDPEYKKWAKGRAIVVAARKKIMMKYRGKAISRARQVISAYRAGKATGLLNNPIIAKANDVTSSSKEHHKT